VELELEIGVDEQANLRLYTLSGEPVRTYEEEQQARLAAEQRMEQAARERAAAEERWGQEARSAPRPRSGPGKSAPGARPWSVRWRAAGATGARGHRYGTVR